MRMIEIDGSFGEGGGQILRTALAMSYRLKKPFRIFNIRASRKKPGLMHQHTTCVTAAQLISDAEVKGNFIGSSELVFIPGKVKGCHVTFDIGTAGSTSLVLQTIILPLCFADSESDITVRGGTHVPWSPPFHYLKDVFLPLLKISGITVSIDIERWGFYPKGGGIIKALVKPIKSMSALRLEKRGGIKSLKGLSAVGNLPLSIAERQKTSAREFLKSHNIKADIEVLSIPSIGQGTFFFLLAEFGKPSAAVEASRAGFSSLGQRGKRAEDVGKEASVEFVRFLQSNAPVEKRLADQIVLYLALAHEKSSFATDEITKHLLTNMWVIKKFLPVQTAISGKEGEKGYITITPC